MQLAVAALAGMPLLFLDASQVEPQPASASRA
jgi:hypothetical protein